MKKHIKPALWVLAFLFAALFSCNDPSTIGSDLLSGDQLDIEFTDTITLEARTIANDSIIVWGPGVNGVSYQNFAFGNFNDPIFGKSVASIFAQVVSSTSAFGYKSTFVLDSVVLVLDYNQPPLSYGKLDEPFTLEVYEMSQSLDVAEQYTNKDSFSVKPTPLAIHTFVPNLTDSLETLEPNADTVRTVKSPPQLRILLDTAIMGPIYRIDSITQSQDSLFIKEFKGIWLKPVSQNQGLLSFAMRDANTNIRYYYHNAEGKKKYHDYHVFADNPVVLHQRNYYGGSFVEPYISGPNEDSNDSLLFLQGLNGLNIEFDIPFSEALDDIIINKAELILPIISLPGDLDEFDPVEQIYATEILSDTSQALVDDIYIVSTNRPTEDFGKYFGGKPTSDDNYKLNLSAQFQKMIAGESGKKLRFTAFFRSEKAARVVLGGPTNYGSPAKLRLTYTKY